MDETLAADLEEVRTELDNMAARRLYNPFSAEEIVRYEELLAAETVLLSLTR